MSSNKELAIRERVGNFYLENKQMKKSLIASLGLKEYQNLQFIA